MTDNLPPLPVPHRHGGTYESSPFSYYDADDMRSYAAAAVAQEREREREACLAACQSVMKQFPAGNGNAYHAANRCVNAIAKRWPHTVNGEQFGDAAAIRKG